MASAANIPLETLSAATQFLHSAGEILHFESPKDVANFVIFDPLWLAEVSLRFNFCFFKFSSPKYHVCVFFVILSIVYVPPKERLNNQVTNRSKRRRPFSEARR